MRSDVDNAPMVLGLMRAHEGSSPHSTRRAAAVASSEVHESSVVNAAQAVETGPWTSWSSVMHVWQPTIRSSATHTGVHFLHSHQLKKAPLQPYNMGLSWGEQVTVMGDSIFRLKTVKIAIAATTAASRTT